MLIGEKVMKLTARNLLYFLIVLLTTGCVNRGIPIDTTNPTQEISSGGNNGIPGSTLDDNSANGVAGRAIASSTMSQSKSGTISRACHEGRSLAWIIDKETRASIGVNDKDIVRELICSATINDATKIRRIIAGVDGRSYGGLALIITTKFSESQAAINLVDGGAFVNAVDAFGKSPLMHASENGLGSVVISLGYHGANVNAVDNGGRNALMYAARNDHENIIVLLINLGSFINSKDRTGRTGLIHAADQNSVGSAMTLVGEGADLDEADTQGRTALLYTIIFGYRELAEKLIQSGASVSISDVFGRTPLMHATLMRRVLIINSLIAAGANEYTRDNFGDTVLKLAKSTHNKRLIIFFGTPRKKREELSLIPPAN